MVATFSPTFVKLPIGSLAKSTTFPIASCKKPNTLFITDLIIATGVNAILGTQYLDGQQDNIKAIDKQTKAIQEQKLTSSHTTINRIDTEPLVSATAELAKGVSSQIATNKKIVENIEKKNESLDFYKNGLSTLRDTNNNIISPREAEAKVNAEKYIEQKEMNETTIGEFMEFSGEIFNSLSEDAISEGGISLNFNPFEAMLNIYKTDIENEKRELQK